MTKDCLPTAGQAEHLTDVLRRSGTLRDGRVREVVIESSRATLLSRIMRLRLLYDGAQGDAPSSIFFKTSLPERMESSWNGGRQEVAFYNAVAAAMTVRLVPHCFEAVWDAETNAWHLLLEDLADTHVLATPWPLPPSLPQCDFIICARARFHAAWWDHPQLGVSVGTWAKPESVDGQVQRFAERYRRFADHLGDRLSPERRALYAQLMTEAPRLLLRYQSRRNITVIQGDAHVWNCFLPKDGSEDVRLFDWDGWTLDLATDDLAYMMAVHWYPEQRSRIERALLDHYHEALLANGVQNYCRRALDDDYRLSALWQVTTPVWQATNNIPASIWWNNLERIMLAVDDLRCRELLSCLR
jgi:Ecdysteroid kinase-like family